MRRTAMALLFVLFAAVSFAQEDGGIPLPPRPLPIPDPSGVVLLADGTADPDGIPLPPRPLPIPDPRG
ncbi:MAG: hypothetical protein R6X12_08265 [bacterium]